MKKFPYVQAIDHGHFDLREGEIHSLCGENGAGKSTMMKILYGLYDWDDGVIKVRGEQLDHKYNTFKAINHGIGMVHQELMLVKELTVFENIILGYEPKKNGVLIDREAARKKINHYIEEYGMDIQLDKKVLNISVGEAQRVEIIKTLFRGAEILILDEPTAVLTPQESQKLFEILDILKKDGKTIVFISHKLKEVMQISDRVTVMRAGKYINTVNKEDTSVPDIARMMVGREVLFDLERTKSDHTDTVFEVKNIFVPADRELSKIKGISFNIKRGEILGVAGVDGNGQTELCEALTGFLKVEAGDVYLEGKKVTNLNPKALREAGISHIPEDRNLRGLNKNRDIETNLSSVSFAKRPFSQFGVLNRKQFSKWGEELIKKFDIRPANGKVSVGSLSGGNAQKVIVAREASLGAKVLIAAQPTRGVDIGSIESIRKILDAATTTGTAVLLVSADLDEVMSLSDRIIVMYEGRLTGEVLNDENLDEFELGLLMLGGKQNAEQHAN